MIGCSLLQVARENPDVSPAPSVVFEEFGDSFNFKLFVYYDTTRDVQTDLRVAILEAFHDAGCAKWRISHKKARVQSRTREVPAPLESVSGLQ